MGNCISALHHAPSTDHLDYLPYCPLTIMVVHYAPAPHDSPPHWFFEYCLNLAPICLGQQVSLLLRSEDCFNPDPSQGPVAEGRLERIVCRTTCWLMFQIVDEAGRTTV